MNDTKIITTAEIVSVVITITLMISSALFIMSFLFGALTQIEKEDSCNAINYNIERLWPIRAGCWFWKPVNN